MFLRAPGSQGTEPALIMRTWSPLILGVDVQIQAIVAVGAHAVFGVVGAFWHAAKVILMQELALIAFLAERAQPVLAD